MKTCVSCKFVTTVTDQRGVPHCGREQAIISTDMITGSKRLTACSEMRNNSRCGVEAILYEGSGLKEPSLFEQRLKNWFLS